MPNVGLGKSFWNTLRRNGTAAHIHANFDRREGGQNVDSSDEDRRRPRILRPGAIILPNLDIDEDAGLPRSRFTKDQVDARIDAKVKKGDDYKEITLFKLKEPNTIIGNADKLAIRVHPSDAKRVRVWEIPRGKTYADGVEVIGPAAGHEHKVLEQGGFLPGLPDKGWEIQYYVEALTLAGDPTEPAPAAKAPQPPGAHRAPIPDVSGQSQKSPSVNRHDVNKSIYDSEIRYWDLPSQPALRAPGDVWIEIVQATGTGPRKNLRDIGLFTIAPWLMTWNTLKCERVYVAYVTGHTWPNSLFDNHGMVWDLQHACRKAGLANPAPKAPSPDSTRAIPTNEPSEIRGPNDIPFYVIREATHQGDIWVQDEFEIGYCYSPHRWLHIALHVKRCSPGIKLATFVEDEVAGANLGVFNGLAGATGDSVDFGGNLEVSPPVTAPTPAIPRGADGPTVKAHRKAPFGKIILGDYEPRDATGAPLRGYCDEDFRRFLLAQMVQPLLPVDTSWLAVGHVDEFMTFVRANDRKGFRMLFGSVRLMTILLTEVLKIDQGATIHRGKYRLESGGPECVESPVDSWLSMGTPTFGKLVGIKKYSRKVDREKLRPIRERMKKGLRLEEQDVLSIPMYLKNPLDSSKPFGHPQNRTIAENVGMVNMLVVNNHLLIPRPHGPLLEPAKAAKAVGAILKRWFGRSAPAVCLPSPDAHFFWARPGETLEQLAMYFAQPTSHHPSDPAEPRKKLIAKINNPALPWSSMHSSYKAAVDILKLKILNDPANKNAPTPITTAAPPPAHQFTTWMRVRIPDKTIDVIEAYVLSVLEPLGNTVDFIEDFECYHEMMGEVHCGTNAKRMPPELDVSFSDRWWDAGVYDPDYDTSYDPTG